MIFSEIPPFSLHFLNGGMGVLYLTNDNLSHLNTNELHWFALKVFYNKVLWIDSELKKLAVESYYPVKTVMHERNGKRHQVNEPAVSSLIFFRSTATQAEDIQKCYDGQVMLYRNRCSRNPAIISDSEMRVFKMVTSAENADYEFVDANTACFKEGQRVRVTGGVFEGAEGHIQRIHGNRRLVVAIEGIVAVATSYIPSCFLQRMSEA